MPYTSALLVRVYVTFIFCLVAHTLFAQLQLASLFTDHAVVQRGKSIPVWGTAEPGEAITVTYAGKTAKAKVAANGKWMVMLPSLEAGGPYMLTATNGRETVERKDIYTGEVWLCSGQSNMEWKLSDSEGYPSILDSSISPSIRQFFVPHVVALQPLDTVQSPGWETASKATVPSFSAVAFHFARRLHKELGVAIGLIHSSWGGSQAEAWISREAMQNDENLAWYANAFPKSWDEANALQSLELAHSVLGNGEVLTPETEALFTQPGYDISSWVTTASPIGSWDWKGFFGFRGDAYMARYVDVPAFVVGQPATLGLARNDNETEVYINGKQLFAGRQQGARKIEIPANTFREGKNLVLVKLKPMQNPDWFGVGLEGNANELFLQSKNYQQPLTEWKLMPSLSAQHYFNRSANNVGTTVYNAMIAPLIPYALRGVIWYQGESNAGRAFEYRSTMKTLINDWRKRWNDSLSFYQVQLSSFGANRSSNEYSNWPELREAQRMVASMPHADYAVTTDIGNAADIHPRNKRDVGERLALLALHHDYGMNIPYHSPEVKAYTLHSHHASLVFNHTYGGLKATGRYPYLMGFEIAGADKRWHYARAEIVGDTVRVYHPQNQQPVAVRYAWSDAPTDANLFNAIGLPAGSFRTDEWPMVTRQNSYESVLKKALQAKK